jgi:hypothetical protein
MPISTVMLVIALVLFILAALPIPSPVNLGWAGMAFLTIAVLAGAKLF